VLPYAARYLNVMPRRNVYAPVSRCTDEVTVDRNTDIRSDLESFPGKGRTLGKSHAELLLREKGLNSQRLVKLYKRNMAKCRIMR
jgi:hypothetical protein